LDEQLRVGTGDAEELRGLRAARGREPGLGQDLGAIVRGLVPLVAGGVLCPCPYGGDKKGVVEALPRRVVALLDNCGRSILHHAELRPVTLLVGSLREPERG